MTGSTLQTSHTTLDELLKLAKLQGQLQGPEADQLQGLIDTKVQSLHSDLERVTANQRRSILGRMHRLRNNANVNAAGDRQVVEVVDTFLGGLAGDINVNHQAVDNSGHIPGNGDDYSAESWFAVSWVGYNDMPFKEGCLVLEYDETKEQYDLWQQELGREDTKRGLSIPSDAIHQTIHSRPDVMVDVELLGGDMITLQMHDARIADSFVGHVQTQRERLAQDVQQGPGLAARHGTLLQDLLSSKPLTITTLYAFSTGAAVVV